MGEDFVSSQDLQTQHGGSAESIKVVPQDRSCREQIRQEALRMVERMNHRELLTRDQIESAAKIVLDNLGLPRCYLGWTMVAVGSAFWRSRVMTVPYQRRLLLLPHCMRNSSLCAASYNSEGLQCVSCGGCALGWLRETALSLGYRVLIAEGSPSVMRLILSGEADALLGVACLDSLERSLERVLMAGIPCMAVPLLVSGCRETAADEDWILEMIETPYISATFSGRSYLPLMRLASRLVEDELETLAPRAFGGKGQNYDDEKAIPVTEGIAYQYLREGGKYYRPFIVLSVFDALNGAGIVNRHNIPGTDVIPLAVRRVALAVEVFHKASIIHDDIEDDDAYRYGRSALHARWGIPLALNIGDYLIGLGYALLAETQAEIGSGAVSELLQLFSQAHRSLCAGQGAELWLLQRPQVPLSVPEILRIYALKTGTAFAVAMLAGIRLACEMPSWGKLVRRFARTFGIAFQIQNDCQDWKDQEHNKLRLGTDAAAMRPTIFSALAWHVAPTEFALLIEKWQSKDKPQRESAVDLFREFFENNGLFKMAEEMLQLERARALEMAEGIPHDELRVFFRYLTESAIRPTIG
ncbi:MAG: polyprenyl synthetase family protein [Thermogutta sp.]